MNVPVVGDVSVEDAERVRAEARFLRDKGRTFLGTHHQGGAAAAHRFCAWSLTAGQENLIFTLPLFADLQVLAAGEGQILLGVGSGHVDRVRYTPVRDDLGPGRDRGRFLTIPLLTKSYEVDCSRH